MSFFRAAVAGVTTIVLAGACTPPTPVLGARVDTMSGETLRTAVARLNFGECRTLPRTAKGTTPGVTRLQICIVDGGQNAGGPSTPANGVWVARIVNKGSLPDLRWELNPGNYESWIVAYGPAPVKYAIIELSTTSPTDPPRVIKMDGVYHHCGHTKRPSKARANFGNCQDNVNGPTDPPDPAPSRAQRTLSKLGASFLPKTLLAQGNSRLDGPAWIDCGGDCCTTDSQ